MPQRAWPGDRVAGEFYIRMRQLLGDTDCVCVKCGVQHLADVMRRSVRVSDPVQELRCGDKLGGHRG